MTTAEPEGIRQPFIAHRALTRTGHLAMVIRHTGWLETRFWFWNLMHAHLNEAVDVGTFGNIGCCAWDAMAP
jgi:hypothetical protein